MTMNIIMIAIYARTKMKNSEVQYHIALGRHSNIPECCIKFFVAEWFPHFETKWRDTAYCNILNNSKYNYVACPTCYYTDNFVEIHICDDGCGK